MTRLRVSPSAFTAVFCCAYAAVFWMDRPLFRFYPLRGDFGWGTRALTGAGPAMAWYGLMASAGLIALLAALLVPEARIAGWFRNRFGLFACGAMLVCVFLLRRLFI